MAAAPPPSTSSAASPNAAVRCPPFLIAGLLALAAWLAYRNSLDGPFLFDDVPTIVDNSTIRRLWPLTEVLNPPSTRGLTVTGRPIVNLSLALNFALNGLDPRGYRVANLALHVLAALTLFGVIRRTAQRPLLAARYGTDATAFALAITLIWLLHPLQTAAVSSIVQRAEELVALFYLLTLYTFIRSLDTSDAWLWRGLSAAVCLLGMATKEVMVSAPLLVLLYDRTFAAGSFGAAFRLRGRYHAALAGSWLLLGGLMATSGGRGGTAGFGMAMAWTDYATTQLGAVAHYLRLSVWPVGQVFDHGGTVLTKSLHEVLPQAALLFALAVGTGLALWKRPALGFPGVWFFAILAPSSSIVPVADTIFEHRMYLPLAAVVILSAGAIFHCFSRPAALATCALIALALGIATARRNEIFRSELALWTDTVARRPENVRAHYTLGTVLAAAGRTEQAAAQYEEALRLRPDSPEAHGNYGVLLTRTGRLTEARRHFEAALATRPNSAETYNNLGNLALKQGLTFEAIEFFDTALRLQPDLADAHNNLGNLAMRMRRISDAIAHYEHALAAKPDFFDAHLNLANALGETRRTDAALVHYHAALALHPESSEAHYNLGVTLALAGRVTEALAEFESTLRLQPQHPGARQNLDALRNAPK